MQNILMIHMESWDGRMLGCQGLHPAMTRHAGRAIRINMDRVTKEARSRIMARVKSKGGRGTCLPHRKP